MCSRGLVKALLALHASLATSSESLAASIGRMAAGDAPAMLQVNPLPSLHQVMLIAIQAACLHRS